MAKTILHPEDYKWKKRLLETTHQTDKEDFAPNVPCSAGITMREHYEQELIDFEEAMGEENMRKLMGEPEEEEDG